MERMSAEEERVKIVEYLQKRARQYDDYAAGLKGPDDRILPAQVKAGTLRLFASEIAEGKHRP